MKQDKPRIWTKGFIYIFITNICINLGMMMCSAILPKYADSLGFSATVIGLIAGGYGITALLLKIISAPMIDTFNRKHILMIALLVVAIAYLGFSVSSTAVSLVGFRIFQGCAMAYTATCALVIASSLLPDESIAQGIGIFSIAQAACQALGPSIALNIALAVGYKLTFILAAVIVFIAIFVVSRLNLPYERGDKKFRISINSVIAKEALFPTAALALLSAPYYAIWSFIILYGGQQGIPDSQIGLFFIFYASTLILSRPFYGKLADRIGYIKVLVPATLMFACAFYLISVSHSLLVIIFAAVISAFGYGSCQPTLQSLCMRLVSPEHRGAASCTCYIGVDAGSLCGPVIAGVLIETIGYQAMWRCMIIPTLACMGMILIFREYFTVSTHSHDDEHIETENA